MSQIKIYAGYANGWNYRQAQLVTMLEETLKADPNTKQKQEVIGRCDTRYTFENDSFSLVYEVDSSD